MNGLGNDATNDQQGVAALPAASGTRRGHATDLAHGVGGERVPSRAAAPQKDGFEFEYQYDFGDGWIHRIRVKASKPSKQSQGAAYVEAGARACPPEDSGGAYGYQAFLDGLASNPKDDELKSFLQWAGKDFDPNLFDRHAANAALLRMAWNGWGKE